MKKLLRSELSIIVLLTITLSSFSQNSYFSEKKVFIETNASGQTDVFVPYDLNDDVILDFVGTDDFDQVIYLSDGTGYTKHYFSTFNSALPVDFKDFDNNGFTDVLTAANHYYANNGDGTFKGKNMDIGSISEYFKGFEDFDGDGKIDIVSQKFPPVGNDNLLIYFKNSNSYDQVILDKTMKNYGFVKIFDFNNDGRNDVLVLNNDFSKQNFMVFLNNGNRSFTKKEYTISSDILITPACFDLIDYDNDGDLDIAVHDLAIYILENTGSEFLIHKITKNLSDEIVFFRFFDFDYDNDKDIVYITNSFVDDSLRALYILNEGEYNFGVPVSIGSVTGYSFLGFQNANEFENWFVLKDANNDDSPDIILNAAADKQVVWFENLRGSNTATSITSHPQSLDLCEGENASFMVSGLGIISYQWQKDGIDMLGDTLSELTLTGINKSDEGEYRCIVTGVSNSDTSDVASLSVFENVEIQSQPESIKLNQGVKAEFIVGHSGDVDKFQWYKNNEKLAEGSRISGVLTDHLIIKEVQVTDSGNYYCLISGICNEKTTNTATLDVLSATFDIAQSVIILYPNPASDFISVELQGDSISKLELMDNHGRLVKYVNNSGNLNISDIMPGIYFLKIKTYNSIFINKINVIR